MSFADDELRASRAAISASGIAFEIRYKSGAAPEVSAWAVVEDKLLTRGNDGLRTHEPVTTMIVMAADVPMMKRGDSVRTVLTNTVTGDVSTIATYKVENTLYEDTLVREFVVVMT